MGARFPSLEELKATELYSRLLEFGRERSFEEGHALNVTALSLRLFDLLASVHGMGERERRLLFSAAMLHDVGMCRGMRGHHKSSLDMILAGDLHPLADRERRMVASIARYHRKAHPRRRHDHFSALREEDQEAVSKASSILRMADALDRAHDGAVDGLEAEISGRKVVIRARAARELGLEEQAFCSKGRLFEELFGLRLALKAVRQEG